MHSYSQPRTHHLFAFAVALAMSLGSVSVFAGSWFGGETVKGNGVVKKQERNVGAFKGVELSMVADVEVRMGAVDGVSIEADENLLPLIESSVTNGTLRLKPVRKNLRLDGRTLRIVVTAKEIQQLGVSGAGNITGSGLKSPKLELEIAGSGTIAVKQVQTDALEASIGGSGTIKVGGTTRKFTAEIAGSGDIEAQQLKAEEAQVSIAGSGDASLWPVSSLKASIAGSGDVTYYGDPKMSSSVAGSGSIKRLGATPR
ncbi:head GIN domain-containing protein [Caenimonas sp. SL110]|uniref:head GIN domain-containing protein n=1 Tax=Caenimonas sp. SL110 TaxID=1450524 RepID=UPI00069E46C7|nr:head GIN domain-containing protein [Caenimonas sp. SL110]